jgi:hypothetical protein
MATEPLMGWNVIVCTLWVAYAGGIGVYVAIQKGRPAAEGFWLGIAAGPLGWLVVAALPAISVAAPMTSGSVRARSDAAAQSR